MTTLTNQTNVQVTITNTLSNLTYNILTNSALGSNAPAWGTFETVSANGSSVAATNAIPLGTNALFVQAELLGYITDGLIAYWKMIDGRGTNAADFSGNGLELSLLGNPAWGSNYLILEETNQYGDAGSDGFSDLDTSDMTICAWLYNIGNSNEVIASKWDTNAGTGWSFLVTSNGLLDMYVYGGADVTNTGASAVQVGQWTFVALAWHNKSHDYTGDFYFNGVLDSSPNSTEASQGSSGSAHLEVGGIFGTTNASFDGCMRDVAIYNHALTAAQILTNYYNTELFTRVLYPNLLYYKMTEYATFPDAPEVFTNSASPGTNATGTAVYTAWTNGPNGLLNTAVHFHGTGGSCINTSNSSLFNFTTNPFTINLWLRPDNEGSYYMGNDTYNTNGWYLSGVQSNTPVRFGGETNGDHAIITIQHATNWPASTNSTNAWNMVTVTYDGINQPLIYVNAQRWVTQYAFASPTSSTNCLIFGQGSSPYGPSDLDGDIWLPQIWSNSLAPNDILNLFFNQQHGVPWP